MVRIFSPFKTLVFCLSVFINTYLISMSKIAERKENCVEDSVLPLIHRYERASNTQLRSPTNLPAESKKHKCDIPEI